MAFLSNAGVERLWAHIVSKLNTKVDKNSLGGTVEVTSGDPEKEQTVLTVNPDDVTVNLYTAEEVDGMVNSLSEEIVEQGKAIEGKEDKPNEPVLIETIIIEEKVGGFYRHYEPDGKLYQFKKLVVQIEAPKAESGETGNWTMFPFGSHIGKFYATIPSFPSTSNASYGMYVIDMSDGFTDIRAYKGNYKNIYNTQQIGLCGIAPEYIDSIEIPSACIIPAGTKFEIYGVRA